MFEELAGKGIEYKTVTRQEYFTSPNFGPFSKGLENEGVKREL